MADNETSTSTEVTTPPTVPSADPDDRSFAVPEFKQRSRRSRFTWGLVGLVAVALVLSTFVRLPYYRRAPGSVRDSIERVTVGNPEIDVFIPNEGSIGFVTVSEAADITVWQWLDGVVDDTVDIVHEDQVEGDRTTEEKREEEQQRMQLSKNSALVVALQRLGYELTITPLGVAINSVFPCGAADGVLNSGDLIVGLDGEDVRSLDDLSALLSARVVEDRIELLVERLDPADPSRSSRTDLVGLTLGASNAECLSDDVRSEDERPFIGVGVRDQFEEELPIDVGIRTDRVGGSSAGLAFTLAILDVLSDGELTNGMNIVATGTIARDGSVGPIGGLRQKVAAVERANADLFLVPNCCENFADPATGEPVDTPSNIAEAMGFAEDVTVVGVDNLDDALRAIGALGGDVERFLSPEAETPEAEESDVVEPPEDDGKRSELGADGVDVEDGDSEIGPARGERQPG